MTLETDIVLSPSVGLTWRMPMAAFTTREEWQLADEELATSVVPAVLLCESVEEKNTKLCDGVYQFFAQPFGVKQLRRKKPTQGSGEMRNPKSSHNRKTKPGRG